MIRFLCSFCQSHNMVGQAVINIRWVGEAPGARCVRWPLQRPSNRRREYYDGNYTECVLPVEPTSESEHVSQTVLQWSWEH